MDEQIERAAVRISERSSEYLHDYLSELPDKAWEAMTVALCEIAQEEITAAHSVIAGKVAELTWQPIETAPRDGSHVLLWTDTHCGGALSFAELVGIDRTECAQIGAWDEDHWHTEYIGEPTHWMKLPDPPAALAPYPERR